MKLIHKLFLGYFVIIALTWAVGYLALSHSKNALQKAIGENTVMFAEETLDKIDRTIYNRIEEMQAFAKDTVLQRLILQSNQEVDVIENPQAYIDEKDKEWRAVPKETITPFMHKLIDNELSEELREKIEFYEEKYDYRIYGEIFITNKYGANAAQTGKTNIYYQADEEWWQAAKRDGLYVRDVAYDESADVYSIDIGVRVNDEKGNFLGVIKAVLNIRETINILKELDAEEKINHEWHTANEHKSHELMHFELINKNGMLIVSTKKTGHKVFEYIDEDMFLRIKDETGINYFIQPGDRPGEREELVSHAHSQGYKEFKSLGWILLSEYKTKEIFAPVTELRGLILIVCMTITSLGLLLSFIISITITKSIKKLHDATNKIGKGELNTEIDIDSRDEIGQLAMSFKKMTNDLKATTVKRDELIKEIQMREQSDKMHRDSEERFRSVAESANDAIIYIDSHGEIIFWNKASETIFDYSADEIVGKSVTLIIPERLRKAHEKGIERVRNKGESNVIGDTVELIGLKKDGSEFPLEMSLSTWETDNGTYFTAIIRDITDRKESENIIKNQVSHLSTLRSIDKAIIASLDLDVTLDVLLTHVKSELKIDAASVLLFNQDTQMLEYRASTGFQTNALKHTRLKMGESYAGRAAIERNIINIPNLNEDSTGFERSPLFSNEGFISYFAIPLIAKGEVLGVIEIFHRSQLDVEPEWVEFIESIATQGALALDNSFLFNRLQSSNVGLALAYDRTLEGWSRALDMRDKETEGHSQRVTELTVRIAQEFKIKGEELQDIRRGALLHDIGKMGIPDSILLKPGKLTEEEWTIMKLHPIYARDLLYPIEFLRPAIDIPFSHHEKWDGTGYPVGIKGENIPLSARIFAVVDVWDALRSDRPYRPAWSREKVIEHIRSLVGTHFDAGVIEIFLSLVMQEEELEVVV